MNRTAKFNIGDYVIHTRQGYRGIVIDVDPLFQASGRYNPQALKRAFAQRNPWYRLLVDGSNQMTYVEEKVLQLDLNTQAIDNPQLGCYLIKRNGQYCRISQPH